MDETGSKKGDLQMGAHISLYLIVDNGRVVEVFDREIKAKKSLAARGRGILCYTAEANLTEFLGTPVAPKK